MLKSLTFTACVIEFWFRICRSQCLLLPFLPPQLVARSKLTTCRAFPEAIYELQVSQLPLLLLLLTNSCLAFLMARPAQSWASSSAVYDVILPSARIIRQFVAWSALKSGPANWHPHMAASICRWLLDLAPVGALSKPAESCPDMKSPVQCCLGSCRVPLKRLH